MERQINKSITFSKDTFQEEIFELMMEDIVRDFFLSGISVNGIRYSIVNDEVVMEDHSHDPSVYDYGLMMLFVGKIAINNDLDSIYPIEHQMRLITRMDRIFSQSVDSLRLYCSNESKIKEYTKEAQRNGVEIVVEENTSIEVQGDTSYIAEFKLRNAPVRHILMADDTGLEINALLGLPGPYVKDFLIKTDSFTVDNMISRIGDTRVTVETSLVSKYSLNQTLYTDVCKVRFAGEWVVGKVGPPGTFHCNVSIKGKLLVNYEYSPMARVAIFWTLFTYRRRRLKLGREREASLVRMDNPRYSNNRVVQQGTSNRHRAT